MTHTATRRRLALLCVTVLFIACFFGCSRPQTDTPTTDTLSVQFIDVGQADAALLLTEEGAVLIDAGESDTAAMLCAAVEKQVSRLSYLILTHPHSDHIGGATYILTHMDVDTVVLPQDSHTTATYARLLDTIETSGATILFAVPELRFDIGGAEFRFLAPLSDYDDLNENSAVIRVEFGETSLLFTGDSGRDSEAEQLSKYGAAAGGLLDVDVLKIGHHGSYKSTTDAYLAATTPAYAVISCGKDNEYGHPHTEVLLRLRKTTATVLRTDELGTITFLSDGREIRPAS